MQSVVSTPVTLGDQSKSSPRMDSAEPVVLIPCSAGSSRQWKTLIGQFAAFEPVPHELYGHGPRESWHGDQAFSVAEEAAALLAASPTGRPFHLVGHSYGGAVALNIALTCAERLLSLTLIEPSCFHILKSAPSTGPDPLDEIRHVATRVGLGVLSGDHHNAMAQFIDFWSGSQSWGGLPDVKRAQLAQLAVQIQHQFRALFDEPASLVDYARVTVPTLILCGTRSPRASREITRLLTDTLPNARHRTIRDAGHMSPLTHPVEVNALILEHLLTRCPHPNEVFNNDAPAFAA
jgi:pimeloyl-ACP methyl ester carboxylesterase